MLKKYLQYIVYIHFIVNVYILYVVAFYIILVLKHNIVEPRLSQNLDYPTSFLCLRVHLKVKKKLLSKIIFKRFCIESDYYFDNNFHS